jgi:GT2 family glycosyltransferase
VKSIFKRLRKAKKSPAQYVGVVDEFTSSDIRGWVSYSDNSKVKEPVYLRIKEIDLLIEGGLKYREDLEKAGIAEGFAAYAFEYSASSNEALTAEILVGDVVVLTRKIISADKVIKNKDPYLNRFYANALTKSMQRRLDDGMYIQMISSSSGEHASTDDYFYRIENISNVQGSKCRIGQSIESDSSSLDIVSISVNSNSKLKVGIEILSSAGESIYKWNISVFPGWRKYEVALLELDYNNLLDVKSIAISVDLAPHEYIDFGYIFYGEIKGDFAFKKPKVRKSKIELDKLDLINSNFNSPGVGHEYTKLYRKFRIASGVIFEQKKEGIHCVDARLGIEGLDLHSHDFEGYARICYSIDISQLKHKPLFGSVSCLDSSSILEKINSVYIYAKGKTDSIVNKIRLSRSNNGLMEFSLPVDVVAGLITGLATNYEYRLAIEIKPNVNIESLRIELTQEKRNSSQEVFSSVEDLAIAGQIEEVAGYFDVMQKEALQTKLQYSPVIVDRVTDIVIPVFNAKEYVCLCVESIIRYTTLPYNIIFMDDCSTDGVSEVLDDYSKRYANIRVVHNDFNLGYTVNVNKGFSISSSDWVVLLNSDTQVTPYWLEGLYQATKDEGVAIVGPLGNAASWQSVPNVHTKDGAWDFNLLPKQLSFNDISYALILNNSGVFPRAGVLNGFCQLINRDAFFSVGALDEVAFPKGYGEENDLCARLVKSGYDLVVSPISYVYHHKSKSFGHDSRLELSKLGSAALKLKHPDYNWSLVSKKLYNDEEMIRVRAIVNNLWNSVL